MDNRELDNFKFLDQTSSEKKEAQELEVEDEQVLMELDRKLSTNETKIEIETLMSRIIRNDIILHPEYQRNYVWSSQQASSFIESLFINIPIAPVFTNENTDGTQEVIDGQQRLTTIYKFYKNELLLKGLTYFPQLNGKKFNDLSSAEQRSFLSSALSVIRVNKESSEDVKFDVFTRINQGGTPLTKQELRRVLYRGDYIDFLDNITLRKEEWAKSFNEVFDSKQYLTKNLNDQETALRLIVISKLIDEKFVISEQYKGNLQQVYANYLKENQNNTREIKRAKKEFEEVIDRLSAIFPNSSERFSSYDGRKFSNKINKAVAEFEYLTVRFLIETNISIETNDIVRQKILDVLALNENDSFGRRAPNKDMLELRLMKIKKIIEELEVS